MKVAISFTSFLRAIHDKKVDPELFDQFYFGCNREHLIRADDLIPVEITELNVLNRRYEKPEGVNRTCADPESLVTWTRLFKVVEKLDREGNVMWGHMIEEEYYKVAARLLKSGHEVFYQGLWRKADEYAYLDKIS
jgi:hypothetical protein